MHVMLDNRAGQCTMEARIPTRCPDCGGDNLAVRISLTGHCRYVCCDCFSTWEQDMHRHKKPKKKKNNDFLIFCVQKHQKCTRQEAIDFLVNTEK